ncbi:MAG: hypothetical protein ABH805_02535 [Candidatus Nealsonbacteria bacterium]
MPAKLRSPMEPQSPNPWSQNAVYECPKCDHLYEEVPGIQTVALIEESVSYEIIPGSYSDYKKKLDKFNKKFFLRDVPYSYTNTVKR